MKFYVDLSLARSYSTTSVEHAGTTQDPYSWSDVKKHLILAASDGFDDGSNLDANRRLDSDGFAVEFLCFGMGDVLDNQDKINVSSIHFSDSSHIVKFSPRDPKRYGLPVLTSGVNPIVGSWFGVSNSLNFVFDFDGFIIDSNQSTTYTLLDFSGLLNPTLRVQNNVVLSRDAGFKILRSNNMQYAKNAFVKNTILVRSTSTIHHTLVDISGSQLSNSALLAANYVAKHSDTTNTVTVCSSVSGCALRTSGNRYSYSNGFNDYSGSATRTTLESDLTMSYSNQGVFNDSFFGGSGNYSPTQTTAFWPIHRGELLAVCAKPSDTYGTLGHDALGRVIGDVVDAGAIQKNYVPFDEEIHVDLSQATHDATKSGSDDSPLSLPDFLLDYARRAPVVSNLKYVLRNENATPIASLDLGPISTNTSASDRSYNGTGSIEFTSYKRYALKQALLSVNLIKPNAKLDIKFDNVRLLWSEGADWIKTGDVQNTGYTFALDRCVVKSTSACTQSLVDQANDTCAIRVSGSSLWLGNTQANLDAAGVFVNGANTNLDCVLNIIASNSSNMGQAAGVANFKANYVQGVATFTFANADVVNNRANTSSLDAVFVDHDNADFRKADFRLSDAEGNAHNIVSNYTPVSQWLSLIDRDARGLLRDAGTAGSPAFDAGAYEYDYLIPQKRRYYVDLNKQSSGHSGKQIDKWSISDLRDCLLEISTSVVDTVHEFVASGYSGDTKIVVSNLESSDTGKLVFLSDNPNAPATYNAGSSVFEFDSCINTKILIDGVIIRSEDVESSINLKTTSTTEDSTLSINRSIIWKKQRAYFLFTSNVFTSNSFACGSTVLTNGSEWVVGATVTDTIRNIASAFKASAGFASDFDCYVDGLKLVFVAIGSTAIDLDTDATGVTIFDSATASNNVFVGAGWNCVTFGTTITEVFDPGVARTTVGINHATGSRGSHQAIAFQGTSTKSGVCVSGNSDVAILDSRYNNYTAPVGCVETDVASSTLLYTNYAEETIVPANFDLLVGYDIATLTEIASMGYDFDYEVDITGAKRSRKYTLGLDTSDVGAVEKNKILTNESFPGATDDPVAMLTPEGQALNIRHDIDGLAFKIVGYSLNNSGYLYWQPNKVSPLEIPGAQAHASVALTSNTFLAGNSITVTGASSITITYNTSGGFVAGSSIEVTLQNIANAFAGIQEFRDYFYCVLGQTELKIFAKRFGLVGNSYAISSSGSSITTGIFSGGIDPETTNKVWPEHSTYAQFERVENPDQSSQSYVIRLTQDQANYPFGELAIIAEILDSPIPDEVGTYVVYAVARFGLHAKHSREVLVKRFIFQF